MDLHAKKKGSTLILVIILTFALSAVVASLLQSLVFDKRLNRRINLLGESRNAAEGAVEIAVAEIDRRAASYSSLTATTMSDYTFPDDMRGFLASGHVNSSSLAFRVGNLSPLPPDPITIDAVDPFNMPDIDKGKPVILRHAYVYGKASVVDPASGQTVNSYISNLVQIREQTWLNYAVFYNLDMEMHSGSTMDVTGPVHTNENAYLTAGAGEKLRFYGSLTTPKKILRKYKYGGISVTHTGTVHFPNKDGASSSELLTMSTSEDSNKSGFKVFAENRWKGFVQDVSFAVPVFNPPGLLKYIPDDPAVSGNQMRNHAYAMVEPQLADVTNDDAASHKYYGYKGDVLENQKFSALAGLTIRIKPVADWPSTPPTADLVIAGSGTVERRPYESEYSYYLAGSSALSRVQAYTETASRPAVTAGTTYRLSCYYKGTSNACSVWVRWFNSSGAVISDSTHTTLTANSSSWQTHNVTMVAPTGAVKAGAYLQNDGSANVYFHDMRLTLSSGGSNFLVNGHLDSGSGTTATAWTSEVIAIDPGFELLYYTGSTNASRPVNRANLPERDGSSKKPIENIINLRRMDPILLAKLLKAVVPIRYQENTSSGTAGNRALIGVDSDPVTAGAQTWYGIYDRRQGYVSVTSSTTTANNALMGAHNAVHVDLGAFNTFLNADDEEWDDQIDPSIKVYVPDAFYSGVVYVQVPLIPGSDAAVTARKGTAQDNIRPAVAPTTTTAGYAVVLRNAGTLPSLPSDLSKRDDGFTFATNGPVYIRGHYNADGNSSTGSSTSPDSSAELPALIAADAVTLLSSAYTDADMSSSATLRPASDTALNAAFTEVAAGIISGIVPTQVNASGAGSGNQWAGGVHNFVRFLENWSGDTYRYRGSVVALYENEVSKRPWYQSGGGGGYPYWYNFPARDVGYHVYFSGGRFPPGLPVMRTVRRISVADITEATYTAGPPTPPAAAN
jgi:hypothetical protein